MLDFKAFSILIILTVLIAGCVQNPSAPVNSSIGASASPENSVCGNWPANDRGSLQYYDNISAGYKAISQLPSGFPSDIPLFPGSRPIQMYGSGDEYVGRFDYYPRSSVFFCADA